MTPSQHVVCPAMITSPVAAERGLPPNVPCAERVPVVTPAEVMQFRCPRGHYFLAGLSDVRDTPSQHSEERA